MHLISSLCAGMAGAANGHAELYVRDTSTRATWYSSFEGDGANSSGADITLDAYGAVEVYVNQLVDVVVKDEDGNTVRSFTDGYASPNIEVISPAFTGVDYVTAASAVSEPTTLQAVLNLWATNAGAPDWKVLIGGVNTTLLNAFGITSGMWFNVKSPAYGAVGDGVTDDQVAIAAALAAAVAAGGGTVFFPKGTYLISTAIEWSHLVSIVGMGADLSIVTTNSAANARIFTWTSGSAQAAPVLITGLSFASTQSNTGSQLYATVAVNQIVQNCFFGQSTGSTGTLISYTAASNYLWLEDCRFNLNGAANTSLALSATSKFFIRSCRFYPTNTSWGASMLAVTGRGSITDCVFDLTGVTGASVTYGIENLASTDRIAIWGASFPQTTQTFDGCFKLLANSSIITAGCDFDATSATSVYTVSGTLEVGSSLQLIPRNRMASSAAPTIPDGYAVVSMVSTTTVPLITLPAILFPGQELIIFLKNNSGAGWAAISFAGGLIFPITNVGFPVLANNLESGSISFVATDLEVSGTYLWTVKWSGN